MPIEQWDVLLPDSQAGYITWEQFQRNQQRLRDNAQAHGKDRRNGPPRKGCALLQGIAEVSGDAGFLAAGSVEGDGDSVGDTLLKLCQIRNCCVKSLLAEMVPQFLEIALLVCPRSLLIFSRIALSCLLLEGRQCK